LSLAQIEKSILAQEDRFSDDVSEDSEELIEDQIIT